MTEPEKKDEAKGAEGDVADTQVAAVEGDALDDQDAPAGHPQAITIPQVLPEAAKAPKRAKARKGETRTLVYAGPADVFTHLAGEPGEIKFRPGVPTEIGADDADELLTYPNNQFSEVDEAEEDGSEVKEQDHGG